MCRVGEVNVVLAEVQYYFFKCNVRVGSDGIVSFWFVAVSFILIIHARFGLVYQLKYGQQSQLQASSFYH